VPIDYAADLLDTLDGLAEILRHVEHDLRHALAEVECSRSCRHSLKRFVAA
jgi:hypothetical protein